MTFRLPASTDIGLTEIRRAAAGQASRLPRNEALRLLAASRFPNRHRDLEAVLADDAESVEFRCLAATLLGQQADDTALRILLEKADIAVPDVLDQIIRAIGQMGDETALPVLDRISATAPAWIGKQATFSAALIAYRHGLNDRALPLPERSRCLHLPKDRRLPVDRGVPNKSDLNAGMAATANESYGIEYDEQRVSQLSFEGECWMLLLRRDLRSEEALGRLTTGKTILGAIVERVTSDPEYVLSLLILSTPAGDGRAIRLHVHDLDGELLYLGDAGMERHRVLFSLETVARPVAIPLEIEGELNQEGIQLSAVHTASIRNRKRHVRRDDRSASSHR